MDDVAQHVGIGKGTIYLHWKTREALFEAVIQREFTVLVDEFLASIRADPREPDEKQARAPHLDA